MIATIRFIAVLACATFCSGQTAAELAARASAAAPAEAAALYRKALSEQPSWAEGWWKLGTLLYDSDDYAGAATAFEKAVAISPKSGVGWVMLGLSEAKLGRNQDALDHIERGRALGGGDQEEVRRVLLFTEGRLLLDQGKFGRAQQVLDDLASDGPNQPEDEVLEALGQSVLGIVASPVDDQRKLVLQAGRAEYHAVRRSEIEQARSGYAQLAADYPRTHNVQFAYGRFLLDTHQEDEAVQAFEREIQNSPKHILARLGIAGIKATSDPAGGLPYAQQALQLAPQLAEAHFLTGWLLLNTGEAQAAIPELEQARSREPGDARIHYQLGRAYTAVNRKEDAARARAEFKRLDEASKNDASKH